MGGAVGEVHGAKLAGLLERALDERPAAVLLLVDPAACACTRPTPA